MRSGGPLGTGTGFPQTGLFPLSLMARPIPILLVKYMLDIPGKRQ